MRIVEHHMYQVRIYDTLAEPERLLFGEDTHLGIAMIMMQKLLKDDPALSIRVEMTYLNRKMSVCLPSDSTRRFP